MRKVLVTALGISLLALGVGAAMSWKRLEEPSNPITAILGCLDDLSSRCIFPVTSLGGGSVADFEIAADLAAYAGLTVEMYGAACASSCTLFADRVVSNGGTLCTSEGMEMWLHEGRRGPEDNLEFVGIEDRYRLFRPAIQDGGGLPANTFIRVPAAAVGIQSCDASR